MGLIVKLHNIQSIVDYQFEFPDTGIIEFTGDNSNGKSILRKALVAVSNLSIVDEIVRNDLIRNGEVEGEITIGLNEFVLQIMLRHARKDCTFSYMDINDTQPVERTFADKEDLIRSINKLGLGIFGKERLCIQLQYIKGPMPFVDDTVSPQTNAEIVESITKDQFAVTCLENYRTNTEPIFRQRVTQLAAQAATIDRMIQNYKVIDLQKYEELSYELGKCLEIKDLKVIDFIHLKFETLDYYKEIHFKKLHFMPILPVIKFTKLVIPNIKVKILKFVNLAKDIADILSVENHKCPTCGQYIDSTSSFNSEV